MLCSLSDNHLPRWRVHAVLRPCQDARSSPTGGSATRQSGGNMKARRWVRAVAGISVLAAASVGLLATGASGASDPSAQFDNLKPIKAPSPCKNDTGVSDDTIKVGAIVPT